MNDQSNSAILPLQTLRASFKGGLTVITRTRNRPDAFGLLEQWMRRQTHKWNQWIVVNDGVQPYKYTLGQEVVKLESTETNGDGLNSGLLAALSRIAYDRVVFIDDDCWLGSTCLESMSAALEKVPLVGNGPELYYNVAKKRWWNMRNGDYARLGQTAVRAEVLPFLADVVRRDPSNVDIKLWREWSGDKKIIQSRNLHVTIKGMPGDHGVGVRHGPDFGQTDEEAEFFTLRKWIGEDVTTFLRFKSHETKPVSGRQTACIITCHNYGRYLEACVKSCLSQTVPFASVVVVDDASTDNTREIVERFAARGVRYVRGEWKNFSRARNAGAAAVSRTSFLLFVDADNVLSNNYHELLLAGFDASNVGAVYGNIYQFNDAGEFLGYSPYIKPFDYHQLRVNNYADACALIRRETFDQMRGWADGAYLTDWMMWLAMTRHGWKLRFMPTAVLNYRVHDRQMSWERFNLWEPHVEPLCRSCMTSIVTLFSGRRWALDRYERWLRALKWERSNLHLVALDNSGDAAYSEELRALLGRSGLAFSYVRDDSRAVSEVPSNQFTDSRLERSRHAYELAAHLARLYATVRQHVPAATDFIWTVEEDIEPPADALHHLCLGLFQHKRAGVVTGAARSRFENRWLLWKGEASLPAPPARSAYTPVDATGFYCALFRRQVWDALAFRPTRDWSLQNCAYDWAAMHDVIKNGWQVMVSGSVICKHWQENGTFA